MNICVTVFGYWTTFVLGYIIISLNLFILKKSKSDTTITWISFLMLFLVLLVLPVIVLVIPLSLLYKRLVHKTLQFKHKDSYGGLLHGGDVIHLFDEINEGKIKVLFIVEYDESSAKSFFEHAKEQIFASKVIKCPKARAIFQKSGGYYYYLKNKVDIEDCVKKLTVTENKTDMSAFMKFYDEIEDVPYPGNNFGFWDVFIGTHPIDWKPQSPNKTYYPILLRYHHSLFDGYHLITTIFGNFSDSKMTFQDVQKLDTNIVKKLVEKTYVLFRQLYETCTFPWRYFLISNANNISILCKSKLQNKKIFSYRSEENPHYIQLIKEIKRQVHGSSFTDVILAALSSSLSKHIIKNSSTIPNHITISTPEVPKAIDLLSTAMQGEEASLTCKNKVHFSLRSLPVDEHMDMMQRLNLVKDQGGYLKSPYQILVDYYVMTFISSTFPDIILKKIFNCMRNSAIVTNLPGPPKTTCLSGHPLEMMIMHSITKSSSNTGISCLFSTYDGRLQTTLTADRSVISSKRDMDDILLNIYKSFDELYHQVCANNNSTN